MIASQAWAATLNPPTIPAQAKAYGMTYSEWSARWWQWALSLPADQNPFFDIEGSCANGANGQLGPVWFLTGVISESGTAVRDCTVPAGKALFFPVINTECSTIEAPPFYGTNEAELRECATAFDFADVYARVDGANVRRLERLLVTSPLFNFTLPENNVLGLPAGSGQSVSNGYFVMLPPLPVGEHEVCFGGSYPDFGGFALNICYNLTVTP